MNSVTTQNAQSKPAIHHYAYRNAHFMTGNVVSDHQFSVIIPTTEYNGFSAEHCIKRSLDGMKHYLTQYQYKTLFDNAMKGIKQTVYVIRHKNIKQGIFVLDHKGECLMTWHHLERNSTYQLMDQVIKILTEQKRKSFAMLVEMGREHLAC